MKWMLQRRQAHVTAAHIRITSQKPYHGREAGHELPVWRNRWSAAHLFPELPAKPLAADEVAPTHTTSTHMCVCIARSAQSSTIEELFKFKPHSRKGNGVDSERRRTGRMRFAVANKAYMAVTLGAAIELKEQVAKPCSSAAKRRAAPVLAAEAGRVDGGAEESLRMVMYLSCWGPS
ncbi:uncharacterized protein C2845_PM04G26420 [Panicum miliaceum]|uniref:Uncharacterized protein n=1 Tax=Panicum miliaceum TaxID=4540 RepID=A0A3L6QQ79_PANMI|nr:uncharacterized protein C2845_PM04G26420 [Panicum miliaceum]